MVIIIRPAPGIWCNDDVLGGIACVDGQRLPVMQISDAAKAGWSVAKIMQEHPTLTVENIANALAWQALPLSVRKARIYDALAAIARATGAA